MIMIRADVDAVLRWLGCVVHDCYLSTDKIQNRRRQMQQVYGDWLSGRDGLRHAAGWCADEVYHI